MKRLLVVGLVVVFSSLGWSQNSLMGKVVDAKDTPIVNAQVFLDSINSNVLTNNRGFFLVEVPEGVANIHIYSKKHGLLTTSYNNDGYLKFVYLDRETLEGNTEKDENQVIGYGSVAKEDLTFAIANVETKGEDQTKGFNSIFDLMRARLTGVLVTDDNRVIVRGGTFRPGPPLFVVDGTIVPTVDWVNPLDVKEISVLKDAAASIYGSRAANGVILIETRKN